MDTRCLDLFIDENYDCLCLPVGDPGMDLYVKAVERYENSIGELHEALPGIAQNVVKAFTELALLELKMAFKEGLRAGIKFCKCI